MMLIILSTGISHCDEKDNRESRDIIGVNHINSLYNLTGKDYINEGADRILELGSRVMKVVMWSGEDGRRMQDVYYTLNSTWPKNAGLIELAETEYFRNLFAKPFSTFVIMTFRPGKAGNYFIKGMSPDDIKAESDTFYEFAKYLMTKYKGTNKTFVLQNWEGDWVLTPPTDMTKLAEPTAIQGMIDWLNARQDGVNRARKEMGQHGVNVYHAAEVNLVRRAMEGKPCAVNSVLPKTHCDLYSYSAWESMIAHPEDFGKALDYLESKAPDSKAFGKKNIYIGEFGAGENEAGGGMEQLGYVRQAVETALSHGVRYLLYWGLYCDSPKHELTGRPSNDDLWGVWLIRPDGTKAPVWYYLRNLCEKEKSSAE